MLSGLVVSKGGLGALYGQKLYEVERISFSDLYKPLKKNCKRDKSSNTKV